MYQLLCFILIKRESTSIIIIIIIIIINIIHCWWIGSGYGVIVGCVCFVKTRMAEPRYQWSERLAPSRSPRTRPVSFLLGKEE